MTLAQAMKEEIRRVARREINKELAPIKRVNAAQRTLIANLRRDVTDLQKAIKHVERQVPETGTSTPSEAAKDKRRAGWMTGKGVRSLRSRLGITQAELAKLAGVSHQTVVKWEKGDGKIAFRGQKTADRMQEIRSLRKKTAAKALAQLST